MTSELAMSSYRVENICKFQERQQLSDVEMLISRSEQFPRLSAPFNPRRLYLHTAAV